MALATEPAATDSSPRKVCDGNASATWRSISSCTSASAAVSRSPRDALVFRTSAPSRATTTSAASRPAAVATRTISSSSLPACSHPRTVSSAEVVDMSTDVCEHCRSPARGAVLSLPCSMKPTHERLVNGSMLPPPPPRAGRAWSSARLATEAEPRIWCAGGARLVRAAKFRVLKEPDTRTTERCTHVWSFNNSGRAPESCRRCPGTCRCCGARC